MGHAPPPQSADHPPPRGADSLFLVAAGVLLAALAYRGYGAGWAARPADLARPAAAYRADLNAAPAEELAQVPGVGTNLAQAIVARRESAGPFRGVADLDPLPGVGPATLERLAPHVSAYAPPDRPVTPDTPTLPPQNLPVSPAGKLRPGDAPLDLNAATEEQLQRLPGVGPTLAARIVAARPFRSPDDLRRVKGIGAKTMEAVRPFVAAR